jgi:hypothetical protein
MKRQSRRHWQIEGRPLLGFGIIKKLTRLNNTIKTNQESTKGEFDVNFGKFFKKQATNLDMTFFEETYSRLSVKQR